jgi:hypothetical protein
MQTGSQLICQQICQQYNYLLCGMTNIKPQNKEDTQNVDPAKKA